MLYKCNDMLYILQFEAEPKCNLSPTPAILIKEFINVEKVFLDGNVTSAADLSRAEFQVDAK